MTDDHVHVTEDAFHRIQSPHPDNPESDENLTSAAQLAIWTSDPTLRGHVRVAVRDGQATLRGSVANHAQRKRAEDAVRRLGNSIKEIINFIELTPLDERLPAPAIVRERLRAQPMLFVTRFCGIDASSVTAAVNDAVQTLDQFFAQRGLPLPREVILLYRNRLSETVVLDIGYVLSGDMEVELAGEFNIGRTPEGEMISMVPESGVHGVFEAHDRLLRHARTAGLKPKDVAWQHLSLAAAHRRADRASSPLYVPVS